MWEVLLLAFALSMDAFAVAIGIGAKPTQQNLHLNALKVALYFGVFQGLMPVIGYLVTHVLHANKEVGALNLLVDNSNIIAFILLVFIGGKMIYEALSEGIDDEIGALTHKTLFLLAIATSIDAMAAGFSLSLLQINPYFSCLLIGVVTFVVGFIGVFLGKKGAIWLESKAEFVGGIILILIAFKLLLV